MTRDEVIRLAKEAGYGEALADLHGPALERFAELVAAEYKRDAERYRWLREQNATLEWDAWCVTNHDFTDEDGPARSWVGADLDAAIDQAMEQPK